MDITVLALSFPSPALAKLFLMGGTTMLTHRHDCGPGNNASLPPIHVLDEACGWHDAGTPKAMTPSAP
jgi:hypothetical protein